MFQNNVFQPGAILHEVIAGALRSKGTTFQNWCKINGLSITAARNVTFGQSAGPRSQAVLERMINDAGREVVATVVRAELRADRVDDLELEPLIADLIVSPLFIAAVDGQAVTECARAILFEVRDTLHDGGVATALRFNLSGHILRQAAAYTRPALMVSMAPEIGPGHAGQYDPVEDIGQ